MSKKTPLNSSNQNKLVELQQVSKYFRVSEGTLKAVNNVNFDIYKGETLGLVGESGCGKSTLGKVLMGIYPPTQGKILYHGKKDIEIKKSTLFDYSKMAQIIFQDPYSSLDPRMTFGSII